MSRHCQVHEFLLMIKVFRSFSVRAFCVGTFELVLKSVQRIVNRTQRKNDEYELWQPHTNFISKTDRQRRRRHSKLAFIYIGFWCLSVTITQCIQFENWMYFFYFRDASHTYLTACCSYRSVGVVVVVVTVLIIIEFIVYCKQTKLHCFFYWVVNIYLQIYSHIHTQTACYSAIWPKASLLLYLQFVWFAPLSSTRKIQVPWHIPLNSKWFFSPKTGSIYISVQQQSQMNKKWINKWICINNESHFFYFYFCILIDNKIRKFDRIYCLCLCWREHRTQTYNFDLNSKSK